MYGSRRPSEVERVTFIFRWGCLTDEVFWGLSFEVLEGGVWGVFFFFLVVVIGFAGGMRGILRGVKTDLLTKGGF